MTDLKLKSSEEIEKEAQKWLKNMEETFLKAEMSPFEVEYAMHNIVPRMAALMRSGRYPEMKGPVTESTGRGEW